MTKTLLLSIIAFPLSYFAQNNTMKEPIAPKTPKELQIHNHTRTDNYFWMNERDSKPVLDHLQLENDYSKNYFSSFNSLTENLLDEFDKRINPNEVGAWHEVNGNEYQVRSLESKDYSQIYLRKGDKEILFLDENVRGNKKSYYDLAEWAPSPNNELVALSEDFVGRRKYTITFRYFSKDKFLKDKIVDTDGAVVWANDNKTVYYVKKDPQTLREFQVYRHVLGSKEKDELVYQENDEKFGVGISKSITDKYIYIHSYSSTTSEVQLIDADVPAAKPIVFLARSKGHLYDVEHHENGFYMISNHNAKNRKILFTPTIPTNVADCKDFIAHDNAVLVENLLVLKNFIVTEERTNGLTKIRITRLSSNNHHYIEFPEETYMTGLFHNEKYNTENLFYHYNSFTTPATVYCLNLTNDVKVVHYQTELLDKTFNSQNYESERIWATANDGTKIPVSLVYKKGIDLKNAPCLLYGYGSYGHTIPDAFSAYRLSLLDRGFVFAIAHIRGSRYMGEEWYEDGKFQKKINTFTDFINAAEYLGLKGFCDPNKIYAMGGSAGGLLMGAVTNIAPYQWKGVVAQVPFVDVVTTMLDETIPLTVGEYEEWGNPNEEDFYYYMLNYSPYDNVKKMDYPALYVTTGYHDSQVQYWEPMKWVAKLRELRTNTNPLIFDCNMDAGHGGGSGRTQERIEKAKEFSFLLNLEGITK
ncbi:MAG: S9 family peptidase [Bacteroidota bacterium]